MLGWQLLSDAEIALRAQLTETRVASLVAELKAAKDYAAKCERLIDHERERVEKEQARADRIADGQLQANGLPAVSAEFVREQKAADEAAAEKRIDYMSELNEIYGETMDELVEDGAESLPEPLAEMASK